MGGPRECCQQYIVKYVNQIEEIFVRYFRLWNRLKRVVLLANVCI